MRISRPLAWVVLLSAVFTAGLLRQYHDRTPTASFLPAPVGSLLFLLLVILFALFLRGWGRRQELPYAGPDLKQVNLLALVPLLIALVGEKWVAVTFYGPILDAAARRGFPEETLGALQVFLAGIGILAVTFALLPLFPRLRSLLREYLSVRALIAGVAGTLASLALILLVVGTGLILLGGESVWLYPRWFGSWAGLRFAGQALLSLGEEIYYRGLLQSEIIFLLPALGLRRPSLAVGAGVLLTSAQFAFEHAAQTGDSGTASVLLFTLLSGLLLGALLVTLRSIYLCALTHFCINLYALGGGLQITDAAGRPILPPEIYVTLYMITVVFLVYSRYGPERAEIARLRAARLRERAVSSSGG